MKNDKIILENEGKQQLSSIELLKNENEIIEVNNNNLLLRINENENSPNKNLINQSEELHKLQNSTKNCKYKYCYLNKNNIIDKVKNDISELHIENNNVNEDNELSFEDTIVNNTKT